MHSGNEKLFRENESYFVCTCVIHFRLECSLYHALCFCSSRSFALWRAIRCNCTMATRDNQKKAHAAAFWCSGLSCHNHFVLAAIFQCKLVVDSLWINFGRISVVYVWCYLIVNFHISSIFIHFDRLKALVLCYELFLSLFVYLPALCAFSSKPCCVYIIYHFHCVYGLVFVYVRLFVGRFFLVFVCLTETHSLWSLTFSSCFRLLVQSLSLFRFSFDAHFIVFSDFSLCCVHFMCGWDSPFFTSFLSHFTMCCGDGRFLCATFRLALFSLWP